MSENIEEEILNENEEATVEETTIETADEKDELKLKDEEIASVNDKLMRLMAEYDNFRKRTIKEKSDMYDKGIMDSVSKFIEVLDNLDRARSQISADSLSENEQVIVSGIELVAKQFASNLEALGVTEIEAEGAEFNPELHNAVTHVEDENFGESVVCEVFQKGYTYNGKVIRYSMVKVAN